MFARSTPHFTTVPATKSPATRTYTTPIRIRKLTFDPIGQTHVGDSQGTQGDPQETPEEPGHLRKPQEASRNVGILQETCKGPAGTLQEALRSIQEGL